MRQKVLAIQMDELHALNLETDSTMFLAYEGQRQGYRVFSYHPRDLVYESNTFMVRGHFLHLEADGFSFSIKASEVFNLEDADLILIRQDPPFDGRYLANTYLLEILEKRGKRILNSPVGIRSACEKTLPLMFPDLICPTLMTEDVEKIAEFSKTHGEIILKPLYGYGGHDVLPLYQPGRGVLDTIVRFYLDRYDAPIIVQPLLREVYENEKRIHLLNGKPVSIFRRTPKEGDVRANMVQGGVAVSCEFSTRDREICERIGPMLRDLGLYLVGIDVIGDYLMEVNVTSPTGLRAAQKLYNINIAKMFFEV